MKQTFRGNLTLIHAVFALPLLWWGFKAAGMLARGNVADRELGDIVILIGIVLAYLLVVLAMRSIRTELDDEGLSWWGQSGRGRVAWGEIQQYELVYSPSDGQEILARFWSPGKCAEFSDPWSTHLWLLFKSGKKLQLVPNYARYAALLKAITDRIDEQLLARPELDCNIVRASEQELCWEKRRFTYGDIAGASARDGKVFLRLPSGKVLEAELPNCFALVKWIERRRQRGGSTSEK